MRLRFLAAELWTGLRRNLTMTIAVVATVAISLALVGAGLLIRQQVGVMKGYWYDKVEVSVYLCGTSTQSAACPAAITDEQRTALETSLKANPLVKSVFYESKDQAFTRFKEQFKDSPELVSSASADALPESFRVKLKNPQQFETLATQLRAEPGVDTVQDQKKLLANLFKLLHVFEGVAIAVAVVQLLAAALLISNTVRVNAFSRRKETAIMRLVGASNLYIRLPFLLEGMLAGLVGGVLASGMVALGKYILIDRILRPSVGFTTFIGWDSLLTVVPVLLLTGVALSGASSMLALRRHLRA